MLWILTGLILTSILMGSITNALTTITFATSSIKLYGTKVGTLFTTCTIYNMNGRVVSDIYKLEPKAKDCISDTTWARYNTDVLIHQILKILNDFG